MNSIRDKQRRQPLTQHQVPSVTEVEPKPSDSSRTPGMQRQLNLPTTAPRHMTQCYREARHSSVLSPGITAAVSQVSEENGVEPWVVFLAAFKAVLARYSRQEEIIVAAPRGLSRNGASGQMVPFDVVVMELCTDLSGNPTFRELLVRVQRAAAAGREQSENSQKALQQDEGSQESISRQVLFAMNGGPELSDLSPSWQSELCLAIKHATEGLEARITYNAELFGADMIERLLLHYQELLKGAAADPDQRFGSLPLVTAEERQQLLVDWNNTKREYPQDQCLHQFIEAQAQRTPDAIAVAFGDHQLSYHELNSRANSIARRLQKLGVRPDVLVGFCVDRSPEMFIGILAILKAGGAYVPLDEAHPDERLSIILSEVQPPVVVTQGRLSRRFSESYPVFLIDEELNSVTEDTTDLRLEMTSDNLAYVIFTSGSTGIPKGVLVSHRSLINHSTAMARYFDLRTCDRVLQFAPCSFDVAAEEIFPTWLSGATVIPRPAALGLTTVSALIEFIENQQITVLNLPAPFWEEWVADLDRLRVPSSVRLLVVGTDKVSAAKFLTCRKQIGEHVRLCNAYGLTEATITTTIYEPDGEHHHSTSDCVPIGRPISNTEVYVLDHNLNLVPIGVAGELYIGGACLARGYLNRPELTAERFIANPYSLECGARIYKTGDLARYLPDGNIEYLGRIDDQVKLRGFRIELGEIESVLHRIAEVQRAAVLLREDRPGDRRLVAYVVCQPAVNCTAENLRMRLHQKLPDYMVPSAIVLLESFPLTPSGKIDRRALPRPEVDRSLSEDSFVACRTFTERRLADIWEEILSVKPIGASDNFFDLGGDSLLGVRLMLQVEKTFGKNFPLAVLYEAPTVGLMSKLITADSEVRQWSNLVALQPYGSKPPFFWIHGEDSDAFLPRYLDPDQPVYGLIHQGSDGRPAPYTTIEEIAAHYLNEIRSVRAQGPYLLGGYCFGGLVAYEIAQQLRKEDQTVPLLVLLAPDRPRVSISGDSPSKVSVRSESESSQADIVLRSWRVNFQRRVNRFRKLNLGQKARYVSLGVSGKIMAPILCLLYPVKKMTKKIACRICLGLGGRLPIWLRSFYILNVYEQAVEKYVAESYAGPIVLFNPFEDPVDLTPWQSLIGDRLEIHHIPGNHTAVLRNQNHLKVWAEALMRHLEGPVLKMFTIAYGLMPDVCALS